MREEDKKHVTEKKAYSFVWREKMEWVYSEVLNNEMGVDLSLAKDEQLWILFDIVIYNGNVVIFFF